MVMQVAPLKDKTALEVLTTDQSPVATAEEECNADQIGLAGNILQAMIHSINDMTVSSINNSQDKNNNVEKSHQHVHLLSPEKRSEIYDEQYNILKRKFLCKKGKKRRAVAM